MSTVSSLKPFGSREIIRPIDPAVFNRVNTVRLSVTYLGDALKAEEFKHSKDGTHGAVAHISGVIFNPIKPPKIDSLSAKLPIKDSIELQPVGYPQQQPIVSDVISDQLKPSDVADEKPDNNEIVDMVSRSRQMVEAALIGKR